MVENNPLQIQIKNPQIKGLELSVAVYAFIDQKARNLDTGEEIDIKIWRPIASSSLLSIQLRGIKLCETHQERDQRTGRMVNKTTVVKRLFGYEAISHSLSQIFPISTEEVQKMVEQAITNTWRHPLFVLQSDLENLPKESFKGKNFWHLVPSLPSLEQDKSKIDQKMKSIGSPLRVGKVHYKAVDVDGTELN